MTSITITCMTSVSAIVMEHYVNNKTDKKSIVIAGIFEESVNGVIPVAVDKINHMAESGSPLMGVNEVGLWLDLDPSHFSCLRSKHNKSVYIWSRGGYLLYLICISSILTKTLNRIEFI